MSYRNDQFSLPKLSNSDYGRDWPVGPGGAPVSQITKELAGFNADGADGYMSKYRHGLNLIRLLWPNEVKLYHVFEFNGEKTIVWNNYFMRIFKACCENKKVALTGCSSSGKTFAVAVYAILQFMCAPSRTTIMVSTTSGSDAERRVWGEIQSLHQALDSVYPVGVRIPYLKVLTFDPGKEISGRTDIRERDIRNGITLIPIPKGEDGAKALGKIIGTKNESRVIWIIDELPNMMDGVLRPVSNLMSNIWFQLIGIGNANTRTDPHGMLCEPKDGWDSITPDHDEWEGVAGTKVIFCHGERGPNFHPAFAGVEERSMLPFPYLSNRLYIDDVAMENGRGDIGRGRNTIDYWRFAIGYWYGETVSCTILSEEYVREHGASRETVTWNHGEIITIAGFDPGWTAGGDSCELMFSRLGSEANGGQVLLNDPDTIRITSTINERIGFRRDIAKQVVAECKKRGVRPADFAMDINGDGALMMQEIIKEWGSTDIIGLSSLEPPENSAKHANLVTQYWYQAADAIGTGKVRGFNSNSRYAKDLFARQYSSVGRGKVSVERKRDMKKRIKRSPDSGDAYVYCLEVAKRRGFDMRFRDSPELKKIHEISDPGYGQSTDEYVTNDDSAELDSFVMYS